MTNEELTCQELVEIITDYLEDTLSPAERRRFEDHLSGCSGCRNYVEQMRQTIRLAGHLSEEMVVESARDALLQVFRDWKQA